MKMSDPKRLSFMLLDYQENGFSTAQLRFTSGRWLERLTAKPKTVSILPAFAHDRKAVEDFIIDIYSRTYDARISVHYPTLMSVRDESGAILAALGFRYAAEEPLFLEQYLALPVEDILKTPRDRIVEIGNLASAGGGASLFLFAAISAYLNHRNLSYAVITGTDFIETRLRSLGLRPRRLSSADPDRLLKKDEDWGSYYNTKPHVLAGDINQGYRNLQRALGAQYTENTPSLISRLHYRQAGKP